MRLKIAVSFLLASVLTGYVLHTTSPALAAPPGLATQDVPGMDPNDLAETAGARLAKILVIGGDTTKAISDCYNAAQTPADMRSCIALDEIADAADYGEHLVDGKREHAPFWSDDALAARLTQARATYAFGSTDAAKAWTAQYLMPGLVATTQRYSELHLTGINVPGTPTGVPLLH